jgi:ribonucleoside-triphosphate reductase
MVDQSLRAKFIKRRSYIRPINDEGTIFETDEQAVNRQIEHQEYLWKNAKKEKFKYILQEAEHGSEDDKRNAAARFWEATRLNEHEHAELAELRGLIESHKVSLSGRVKWMAGTSVIKERPASAFNCCATYIAIPADFVDVMWLLLQGCGVGFKPKPGMLTGFGKKMEVVTVGSERTGRGGAENTTESFDGVTWTIKFGDSAKAWAKGVGKLTTGKYRAQRLVLDLSELRPAGERLRGYGWISSGWEPFAKGLKIITDVLNDKAGEYLDALDIGDIANALGTVLSSRRSAQIWLMEDHAPELEDFIIAKNRDHEGQILDGKWWRSQSNNSIAFNKRPPKAVLNKLLRNVLKGGEPGLYNLERARKVAPWANLTNPCAEIILPSCGLCNLVQIVWSRFNGDWDGLMRAHFLMARANYRQTQVNMRDGVLQLQWNDNNQLLRLCGVSPTGIIGSDVKTKEQRRKLRAISRQGADSMADELVQNRAALVTQVQPGGTSSKVLGLEGDEVQEGAHVSPTRFLLNNVNFSRHDPLVEKARAANYRVFENPSDPENMLIAMPVAFPASDVYKKVTLSNGEVAEVSTETAIDQLERYLALMEDYVDHNCSITISFDETEIKDIVDWLYKHWDSYIGVSFMHRNDPTKTAQDLGFAYLPQEAISEETYLAYAASLLPIDLSDDAEQDKIGDLDACTAGACPIK